MDDMVLVREYLTRRSDDAFTALVERHGSLVYSAALRQSSDPNLAEEITQAVFILLARKCHSFGPNVVLSGWLYRTTRFAVLDALKSQRRRRERELEAAQMNADGDDDSRWEQIAPLLDEAMTELGEKDRDAVLLRFFQRKPLAEVGVALGMNEDAARKRVTRAVDKLKSFFARRGVTISAATIGAVLTERSIQATPQTLLASISRAARGSVAKPATLALANATAGLILWAQLKMVLCWCGVAAVLLATVIVTASSTSHKAVAFNPPKPATNRLAALRATRQSTATNNNVAQVEGPSPATTNHQTLTFRVIDAESEEPLAGVRVRVVDSGTNGEAKNEKLETNKEGETLIKRPASGGLRIYVSAEKHVPKVLSWSEAIPSGSYTMRLERGTAIAGKVVDESQQPIAGVKIEFQSMDYDTQKTENTAFGSDSSAMTDADGYWTCDKIPRNTTKQSLTLTHRDFATISTQAKTTGGDATNNVTMMHSGGTVSGTVTDSQGKPVQSAAVREVHSQARPKGSTKTDAQGHYVLHHLPFGEANIVVQAKELAPQLATVQATNAPAELNFQLTPGKIFRGHVTDEKGVAITNALVQTDWDNQGLRKVEWSTRTDAEGRFEWNGAPEEPLLYWIEAPGYSWIRMTAFKADGTDHHITLSNTKGQRLKIIGTVLDAETGKAIQDFEILRGSKPDVVVAGPPLPTEFSSAGRGSHGKFELNIDPRGRDRGLAIQIRTDGYLPVVLEAKSNGEPIVFNLQKGNGPAGVVLLPDGTPAANATVFAYEDTLSVYIEKPGVFRDLGTSTPDHQQTDAEGRFAFKPKLNPRGLIAIQDGGFADVWMDRFDGHSIVLQPWGVVEGTLFVGNQPAAGETIMLSSVHYRSGENGRLYSSLSLWLKAVTDAEGRFRIEKVPPGERKIAHQLKRLEGETGRFIDLHTQIINVKPGATTQVSIGGRGRPVVGKVTMANNEVGEWGRTPAQLKVKLPALPFSPPSPSAFKSETELMAAWKKYADASRTYWTSAEGQQRDRHQQQSSYTVLIGADGSFRFDDIPAGEYELSIESKTFTGKSIGPSHVLDQGKVIGSATRDVVIPELSSGRDDKPLDLGVIEVR